MLKEYFFQSDLSCFQVLLVNYIDVIRFTQSVQKLYIANRVFNYE